MYIEGFEITVLAPEILVATYNIFLPRYKHLDTMNYRAADNHTFLAYDGMFRVTSVYETSLGAVYVEPVTPSGEELDHVKCVREAEDLSPITKWYLGCA
jgi:hypothetical protein